MWWVATSGLAVAAALAVIATWPRLRDAAPWLSGGIALVSAVASVAGIVTRHPTAGQASGVWALVEALALMVLVFVVTRWLPARQAVASGGLAGLAVWLLPARLLAPAPLVDSLAAGAFWALGAAATAAAGGYLRWLEERSSRAVAAARRVQRLALARDLHDFVAHDISEMLAQAQAAQLVGGDNPRVLAALRRIEAAGVQALSTMDRTVHMLHDAGEPAAVPETPLAGLADLPELIERFAAAGPAQVLLELDPKVRDGAPREIATTIYRIVVEALTNVRRHAPAATRVVVAIALSSGPDGPGLWVTVTDDGGAGTAPALDRRGGLGLPGLSERAEALGGTLAAGPCEPGGWRVTAVLPLPG